jgi:UDP-N-acetylglucosamine 2-epimerase (non-hydrolysing)
MDPRYSPPGDPRQHLVRELLNNPFLDLEERPPGERPRVLVVIGTRPEGIKLAPVLAALAGYADGLETRVALTGQHSELLDQALEIFRIRPDWDLGIMREGQDLYDVAHGCLDGLRDVVRSFRPHLVLVEGDTATVFIAALVAFFERTRVGHVEAGLRSRDKWRPYPEEIFRRLAGVVADLHFAPTAEAGANLLREAVPAERVYVTGNTVVDALMHAAALPHEPRDAELRRILEEGRRLVLLTAHRRESFGAPLREALGAIRTLADRHPDVVVLYPVHPNPNVRAAADDVLAGHDRIRLTQPLDYLDLVAALRRCVLVLTDSGGIQEEAPSFCKPVLVLREVTERPEGIEAGIAACVGTDPERIARLGDLVLDGGWTALARYRALRRAGRTVHAAAAEARAATPAASAQGEAGTFPNPYGDGRAGERIADIIAHVLMGRPRRLADWEPHA